MSNRLKNIDIELLAIELICDEPSDIYLTLLNNFETKLHKNPDLLESLFNQVMKITDKTRKTIDINSPLFPIVDNPFKATIKNEEYRQIFLKKRYYTRSVNAHLSFHPYYDRIKHQKFKETNYKNQLNLKTYTISPPEYGNEEFNKWYVFHITNYILHLIIDFHRIIDLIKQQYSFEFSLPDEVLQSVYLRLEKIDFKNLKEDELANRQDLVNSIIENYFKNKKLAIPQTTISETDHPNEQENTFNNVPIDKVREIFGVLTTERNLKNNKPFLTVEQFKQFINQAFLNIKPIDKINITYNKDSDNIRLRHLFASFFEYSDKHHLNPNSKDLKKSDFVNLFLDNFASHFNPYSFGDHWKKEPLKEKILWGYEELKED
jgi:hypothetical protein